MLTVDLHAASGIGDTGTMRHSSLSLILLLLPLTAQDAAKGDESRWLVFARPGGSGLVA